ncbi:hypothetical protein [Filimonas effusa]|uniref:Uncharacterized protein n=1 Tax=Filimonas effusa TaxID=2508721 RepID=A0A4Q1DB37_9BACT|nr:hypothetical protein [Filimonas effusa]RXK85709.1 hypothetical protein ESB13_02520 [Filimonas effusa]
MNLQHTSWWPIPATDNSIQAGIPVALPGYTEALASPLLQHTCHLPVKEAFLQAASTTGSNELNAIHGFTYS